MSLQTRHTRARERSTCELATIGVRGSLTCVFHIMKLWVALFLYQLTSHVFRRTDFLIKAVRIKADELMGILKHANIVHNGGV
jgi:hypothetical protein